MNHWCFAFPSRRITANLPSPDIIRTEGTTFDLPMAFGILAAMELIQKRIFYSCRTLPDGQVKPVKGFLPVAVTARNKALKGILP